jgi:hypothetical protein
MSSEQDAKGREALLQDVLCVDAPGPELLVRYAEDPGALDAEERRLVEDALAGSPAVRDQLRVLERFDFRALDEEVEPAEAEALVALPSWAGLRELLEPIRGFLAPGFFGQPALVAAAVLLLLALPAAWLVWSLAGGSQATPVAHAPRLPGEEVARVEPAPQPLSPRVPAPVEEAPAGPSPAGEPAETIAATEPRAPSRAAGISREGATPAPAPRVEGAVPSEILAAVEDPLSPVAPPVTERPQEVAPAPSPPTAEIQVAMLDLPALPSYVEPFDAVTGFGLGRTSAVLRSAGRPLPRVTALVPDHEGRTVREAPAVYWYLSARTNRPINVTLVDPERERTVLDITLEGPHEKAVDGLSLARHGVRLRVGRVYQWFVSVLAGDEPGAGDVVAGGSILRSPASGELEAALRSAGPSRAPHVYAKYGLWYDALGSISQRIEAAPGDASLREQRAALLEQVGLDEPAAQDRGE